MYKRRTAAAPYCVSVKNLCGFSKLFSPSTKVGGCSGWFRLSPNVGAPFFTSGRRLWRNYLAILKGLKLKTRFAPQLSSSPSKDRRVSKTV